jgi:hypothetical protein
MYNLSPTTGSNDILGNQCKKVLVSSSNIQYQGNLIVGNSGGTFKVGIPKEVPLAPFVWKSYLSRSCTT